MSYNGNAKMYPTDIDTLQQASKKGCINPMTFDNEVWRQLSTIVPEVKDYYWISSLGKIYSARYGFCMVADMNQPRFKYPRIILSCKDCTNRAYLIEQLYAKAFGKLLIKS